MDLSNFERHVEQIRATLGSPRLFFVAGAPKSGTTWVQKALDAHPEIHCAGEGHFADTFVRELAPVMKRYYAQQATVAKNVYEGKPYYRHEGQSTFAFLATAFVLKTLAGLDIPAGAKLVGDKTPLNVQNLGTLRHLFPDARFVNVVRDGRDVLVSTLRHAQRVARRDGTWQETEALLNRSTRRYASRWVGAVERAERFAAKFPGTLHTLRYEDLKQDFAGALGGVFDFLGVSGAPDVLATCEQETRFERLSGGREAGDEDVDAFFRKGVVGDWRSVLSPQQVGDFHEVAADCLARMGYEVAAPDTGRGVT